MNAQQLKNSILQLAVQGKLVPQDPNDEPASKLVKRIRAEKEKLIKEKKIKPDKNPSYIFKDSDNLPYEKVGKNEPVCIAEEVPFDIPESWEWVRLKNILEIARGGSPRPIQAFLTTKENGIPWIKIGDTNKGEKYINSTKEFIVPEGIHKSRMVYKGDFLLTNSMSFGRPYILNIDGCIHDGWLVLSNLYNAFYIDYLYYLLSSTYVYYQFCNSVSGAVVKNLNSDKVANALIPLPPIEEQQRIVDKLKELEPYIQEYDIAYEKIEELNNNFPEQLKKSILQEAVQGKLVPQNPKDEPASVLIERIREEKQKLIQEKKIKKDKNESYIFRRDNSHYEKIGNEERCIDDEIPFDIPDSWEWIRLGNIGITQTGNTPSKAHLEYFNGKTPFISPADILNFNINYNNQSLSDIGKKYGRICSKDSILQVCIGGSIGKLAITNMEIAFNQQINSITPLYCSELYLFYVMDTQYFYQLLKEKSGGPATPIINRGVWDTLLIPLPPLEEQKRIVEKIQTLMPIIEIF